MIFTDTPQKIRVHFTPFRDGLQSSFGGKVRLDDILPAMEYAAKEAGLRHLEFGGGARYQAPYFYVGENPFESHGPHARRGRARRGPADPHPLGVGRHPHHPAARRAGVAGQADGRHGTTSTATSTS